MKTLKHVQTGQIRRVENKQADLLTGGNNPTWTFAPKSEWKEYRKSNTVMVETPETDVENTKKSGKKKVKKQ
jgi:hypothetical protein